MLNFLGIIGMLSIAGFLLAFLIAIFLYIIYNVSAFRLMRYPFYLCWLYAFAEIFSSNDLIHAEGDGDGLYLFAFLMISIASAIWVAAIIYKKSENKLKAFIQSHPLKEIKLRTWIIGLLCVFVLTVGLPLGVQYCRVQIRIAKQERLTEQYCTYSSDLMRGTSSLLECYQLLSLVFDEREALLESVNDDYPSWRETAKDTNKWLTGLIDQNGRELFQTIVDSCSISMQFSGEEVFTAFDDNKNKLTQIKKEYLEGDYSRAFDLYLDIHNTHIEDSTYYFVSTLYPEVFTEGIYDSLLSSANSSLSSKRQSFYDTLRYINSMPNEGTGLNVDIASLKKQIEEKEAADRASDLQRMQNATDGYPFYIGMRESQLRNTCLGNPDSVTPCRDFSKLQARAQSKNYEWESGDGHGWYKVTVRYRMHNSNRSDDYIDLPSDNGYVSSITWSNKSGVHSIQ